MKTIETENPSISKFHNHFVKSEFSKITDIPLQVETLKFSENDDEDKADFIIKIISNPDIFSKGSIIYFHGGPGQSFDPKENSDFIQSVINQTHYNLTAVEIAGSRVVKHPIEDSLNLETPNYVRQTVTIISYLKNTYNDEAHDFVGFSHSFGAHQLFNYLRHTGENSGFNKVFSSAGVYDTGSWLFQQSIHQVRLREWQEDDIYTVKPGLVLKNSIINIGAKNLHSLSNMGVENSTILNCDLQKALSPLLHADKMPNIPFFFQTVTDDHNVHASQTVGMFRGMNGQISYLRVMDNSPHCLLLNHDVMSHIDSRIDATNYQKKQQEFQSLLINFIKGNSHYLLSDNNFKELLFYEPSQSGGMDRGSEGHNYMDWIEVHTKYLEKNISNILHTEALYEELKEKSDNQIQEERKLIDAKQEFDNIVKKRSPHMTQETSKKSWEYITNKAHKENNELDFIYLNNELKKYSYYEFKLNIALNEDGKEFKDNYSVPVASDLHQDLEGNYVFEDFEVIGQSIQISDVT